MPTFLVSSRMSPELRRRVLRSVRGDFALGPSGKSRASVRRVLRLVIFLTGCVLVTFLVLTYRQQRRELATAHESLRQRWSAAVKGLGVAELSKSRDLIALIENEARTEPLFHNEFASSAELTAWLRTKAIYLRLPLQDAESEDGIFTQSGESYKDSLLGCLVSPPPSLDEKSLLDWLRRINSNDHRDLDNFLPASRLFLAMTVLVPEFGAEVNGATNLGTIRRLDVAMTKARLDQTLPSLRAEALVLALDEPKLPGTVTEIDGASPHAIRLALIDLVGKNVLARFRGSVDPSWVSSKNRPRFAYSLDGCRFAAAAREQLFAKNPAHDSQN